MAETLDCYVRPLVPRVPLVPLCPFCHFSLGRKSGALPVDDQHGARVPLVPSGHPLGVGTSREWGLVEAGPEPAWVSPCIGLAAGGVLGCWQIWAAPDIAEKGPVV